MGAHASTSSVDCHRADPLKGALGHVEEMQNHRRAATLKGDVPTTVDGVGHVGMHAAPASWLGRVTGICPRTAPSIDKIPDSYATIRSTPDNHFAAAREVSGSRIARAYPEFRGTMGRPLTTCRTRTSDRGTFEAP